MKSKLHLPPRTAHLALAALLLSTLSSQLSTVLAQGTAFTYQGRLNNNGSAASGNYDFRFRLASDALGNNYVGGPVLSNALPVSSGLFTITLDFGAGVFTGSNYWLQVDVKTNGAGGYTTLAPLQSLTPSPYAIFANTAGTAGTAGSLAGTLPSGQLAGTYSSAVSLNNANNSFTGGFNGNGSNVTNVNAATLGGLGANQFWKTTGNSNTVVGTNFIGTADNQPLELWAGGVRVLRLEPDPRGNSAGNLVGGFINNAVEQPGSGGDFIGGGGYFFGPNIIHSNSSGIFIGAGSANQIGPNLNDSFIGAGFGNTIKAGGSVIGGGTGNTIQTLASASFIGGGNGNLVTDSSFYSVTGGGQNNTNDGGYSAIGGGFKNSIQDASYSVIGGGNNNTVQAAGNQTTIAGGWQNKIGTNAQNATVGGGVANTIGNNANSAAISGGSGNTIQTNASSSIIGGGDHNTIQSLAQYATIGGGYQNLIQSSGSFAVIGGGFDNVSSGYTATVSGGFLNSSTGDYAPVPGGYNNLAAGQYSFAAGSVAQANHNGAFVWSDSSSFTAFASTGTNQFSIRATGGARFVTGGAGLTVDGQAVATTNAALRTGGNNFTGAQTIIGGDAAQLILQNPGDNRSWYIYDEIFNGSGNLIFQPSSPGTGAYIQRSSGNYFVNSDARLKRDITGLGGVLDRVLQLRPVSYHFRNAPEGSPPSLGLIAQEVEPLFPDIVAEHNGMKSMSYGELIPVTIRAVQELNEKMDSENAALHAELKRRDAENAELKRKAARLDELERRLSILERRLTQ